MVSPRPLRQVVDEFLQTLDAVTVPCTGGRRIPDTPGAVAISEEVDVLHGALALTSQSLHSRYGRPDTIPAGISLEHSDSPVGPGEPVPPADVHTTTFAIGRDGVPAMLYAAIERAMKITAFATDRWNEQQAKRPGGPHRRYSVGDVIGSADIEVLRSIGRLLERTPIEVLPESSRLLSISTGNAADIQMDFAATSEASFIPPYSASSGLWCEVKAAARREGIKVDTLLRYRHRPPAVLVAEDRMSGIDRDGRMWRKLGTENTHTKYLISSLKTSKR